MRVLTGVFAAAMLIAGQAQAKPLAPEEIGGRWTTPGGSCDDWVLHAVELAYTSKDEEALFGVVRVGSDMVRGNIPLDGPRKGKLIWEETMKPAAQVSLSNGKVKLSVSDKASGVKAATLEPCPGTRPDYARYRSMMSELSGAWYEVSKEGGPLQFGDGPEYCQVRGSDPNQRGAMAFRWGPTGQMTWSRAQIMGSYTDWKPVDSQPETLAQMTWLKMDIGTDGKPRHVNFVNIPGSYQVRMYVMDTATNRTRYYRLCQ